MTSEVSIMNKESIVLAADSAITTSTRKGKKIFESANKIFTLSKYKPIGIMIYGNANFMGVPWETIIKVYRNELGKNKFLTLREYTDNFIKFLIENKNLFPESERKRQFETMVFMYYNSLKRVIHEEIKRKIKEKKKITNYEIREIVNRLIVNEYNEWGGYGKNLFIPEDQPNKLIDKYKTIINKNIKAVFDKIPLTDDIVKKLIKMAGYLHTEFVNKDFYPSYSGIVIAGFGEEEVFPSQVALILIGLADNCLNFMEDKPKSNKISYYKTIAAITAFAQKRMVFTFMEGVDPEYEKKIEESLKSISERSFQIIMENIKKEYNNTKINEAKLKKRIMDEVKREREKLKIYRRDHFVSPVTNIITSIPKSELAIMAETLVNLTSFKLKMTDEEETVGGPIDVAIISKGDGFVWIKRKHYFKPELNPQFFENYFMEDK